jgi:hypothetical protein
VLASALRHMDRCELWIPSRRRIVPRLTCPIFSDHF